MEQRSAPPVTIEGGPGWQLDAPGADRLGVEPTEPPDLGIWAAMGAFVLAAGLLVLAAVGDVEAEPEDRRDGRPPSHSAAGRHLGAQVLTVREDDLSYDDAVVRVSVAVDNASSAPVSIDDVGTVPGLAVRVLEPDGSEVALPLHLPVDDVPGPAWRPADGLDVRRLVMEITVSSCADLPAVGQSYQAHSLVALHLTGHLGPDTVTFGNRYPLLGRLSGTSC